MNKFSSPIVDAWLEGKTIKTRNFEFKVVDIKINSNKDIKLLLPLSIRLSSLKNSLSNHSDWIDYRADGVLSYYPVAPHPMDLIIEKPKGKKTFYFAYFYDTRRKDFSTISSYDCRGVFDMIINEKADTSKPYEIFEKTIEVDE